MVSALIISFLIFFVLVGALYWVIVESKKNKRQLTDFYAMFLMGIVWVPISILLKNYALMTTGILFILIGLFNKSEWKKDVHEWKNISVKERKLIIKLIIILGIILLVGIIAYFYFVKSFL